MKYTSNIPLYLQFLQSFPSNLDKIYAKDPWTVISVMKFLPPLSKQLILRVMTFSSDNIPATLFEQWIDNDQDSIYELKYNLDLLKNLHIFIFHQSNEGSTIFFYNLNPVFKNVLFKSLKGFVFL